MLLHSYARNPYMAVLLSQSNTPADTGTSGCNDLGAGKSAIVRRFDDNLQTQLHKIEPAFLTRPAVFLWSRKTAKIAT